VAYLYVGACKSDVFPSPKSQNQKTIVPSKSEDVSVMFTWSWMLGLFGANVNSASGLLLITSTRSVLGMSFLCVCYNQSAGLLPLCHMRV
jgi:hypothetical protein